jgi:eukaryotic-like serine/threonine-protein kinase
MAPDPRRLISDLYHQASSLPPEARDAFLRQVCNGDDELRAEVESLLGYDAGATAFLERGAAAVRPALALTVGRHLGPYHILAPLGAGGMGEVHRARDTKLGREVALKILPLHLTADPERRARFVREARVLATLNHPHIGAIYGLEEADGVTALVLELVQGETLAERLTRGPLRGPHALAIARQIAEALDAAHQNGIVHRDLKPANIVLHGDGASSSGDVRVKVLDFGLAKSVAIGRDEDSLVPPGTSLSGTQDGRILGTPAYMSPEQARGQPVDKRTDIWAFGCVLFEMLSGKRPFDGATVSDTLACILEHEPDWAMLPAATPGAVRTLLRRCLEKEPARRLRDIGDVGIELDDLTRRDTGDAPGDPATAPPLRRERLAWAVAAALAVALSVIALLSPRSLPAPGADLVQFDITLAAESRFPETSPEFAVSPDGRHVAFAATSQGPSMLWLRSLDTSTSRTIPGTEGGRGPFWKPDSRALGFFAHGQLWTVDLSGGSPVKVSPWVPSAAQPSGTWNGSDVILFTQRNVLQRVSARGGGPVPATTLGDADLAHRWPSFLPDGDRFLFLAQGDTDNLRVGSLTSDRTVSLGPFESHAAYVDGRLLFVRGGNLMAQPFDADTLRLTGDPVPLGALAAVDPPWQRGMFSVSATGRLAYIGTARTPSELTWLDRQGRPLGTVGPPGVYFNLDLSPDEQRVAVSQLTHPRGAGARLDIWLIEAEGGSAQPLTTDHAWHFDPAWSPAGTQIAFNSNRPRPGRSPFSLFMRASDASGQDELLVDAGASITAPDWSRDGPFIVYTQTGGPATGFDLWTLSMTGEREPAVFLQTPYNEGGGVFSPDGRWIAYHSDVSGRQEVYVRPFPAREGHGILVSREGGRTPRWRGDGEEIFFLSLEGTMMAAAFDPARQQPAVPHPLFPTHLVTHNRPYAVTKDGLRFLVPRPLPAAPITVVLNWPVMLRDR